MDISDQNNVTLVNWHPTGPISTDEWRQRVQTTILFVIIGSCGIILNIVPILLTFFTDLSKNNVHIMVANLSTADLLFSVSFVFGQTQYILYREMIDFTACRWLAFFTFTTAIFEFVFPPLLALNRYVSLYHDQWYEKIYNKRNIALMVVGGWAFSAIVPLIFTLNGVTMFDDDNLHCCIVVKNRPIGWTVFYWLVIGVPLVAGCDGTMLFCNYKIYKKLFWHNSQSNLKSNVVSQNKEIFYFLFADMMFPILFHTTYHVAKFVSINRTDVVHKRAFTCLYLINSCVRGLITLTMLRPYRMAVKKSLQFLVCKKSPNAVLPIAVKSLENDRNVFHINQIK